MSSTPAKKPRASNPLSAWKLSQAAVRELRDGWKRYALVLIIIAVPSDLLGLSASAGADSSVRAFSLVAAVIMNVALIWAIVEKERTGVVPRPAAAYYDGSIALVRFFVVTLALVVMIIPASLGAVFYTMSQDAFATGGASFGEQALIGLACLLLAMPSIWWLVRFGLAPTAVIASNLRPMAALRYSRRLTIGRFWRVVARYIGLLGLIIATTIPISLIAVLLAFLKLSAISVLFFQLATTFIALPLTNIYLLRLYRDLEPKPRAKSQYEPDEDAAEESPEAAQPESAA